MKSVRILLAATVLLATLPEVALACPVCFDSSAENRMAFTQTAAVLTLLPLGMLAGLGVWIRRRSKEVSQENTAQEQDSTGT